ncbi:MAG: hypothetical protein KDA80_09420 [Planctomycetaceae bacterium]|nr:hypothetical protein [Planctomycetaceae bacterium]
MTETFSKFEVDYDLTANDFLEMFLFFRKRQPGVFITRRVGNLLIGGVFAWQGWLAYQSFGWTWFTLFSSGCVAYFVLSSWNDLPFLFLFRWFLGRSFVHYLVEIDDLGISLRTQVNGTGFPSRKTLTWEKFDEEGQWEETGHGLFLSYPITPHRSPYFELWMPQRVLDEVSGLERTLRQHVSTRPASGIVS